MARPPGNLCGDLCSHRKGDCRVSSGWACRHNVTGASGAVGGRCLPLTSLGKILATVRHMKELSKVHETSCLNCETGSSLLFALCQRGSHRCSLQMEGRTTSNTPWCDRHHLLHVTCPHLLLLPLTRSGAAASTLGVHGSGVTVGKSQ